MSNKAITWVFHHSKAKGMRRLVLVALADFANDNGECWPSMQRLAEYCNTDRRYIIDCLADLVEIGEIEKETRFKDTGDKNSNQYKIIMVVNQDAPPSEPGCTTGGEPEGTRVVNQDAHKPPLNPYIEPPLEEGETAEFITMRNLLSEMTGLLPTPGDIKAIEELVNLNVIADDISGALQWRKENNQTTVKTINQLLPGIKTNRSIRIQDGSARKSGKPSAPRMTKRERSLAALEVARKKSKERESK